MWSWDARSSRFFYGDGHLIPVASVGALWTDDAPAILQVRELARTSRDLEWLEGWVANIALNEGARAMLQMHAIGGESVESLRAYIHLGPDPYAISRPECTIVDDEIVQVWALCDGNDGKYLLRCLETQWDIDNPRELYALIRWLSRMPVRSATEIAP